MMLAAITDAVAAAAVAVAVAVALLMVTYFGRLISINPFRFVVEIVSTNKHSK